MKVPPFPLGKAEKTAGRSGLLPHAAFYRDLRLKPIGPADG